MPDDADLLAPFDDELLETVAGRHDLSAADLRSLLAAQQRQVRSNPGVEDVVYEWRSQFHERPVLERRADAYVLRLRDHVWDEFADAMDLAEVDLRAVLDAHEEQARADTGAERDDGEAFMILARE
jgi:hypothetical protein